MACSSKGANDRRINQFEKITTLNAIADEAANLAAEYGIEGLSAKADALYGVIPEGDFYTVVDLNSPHASLSGLTEIAEHRFAYIVMQFVRQIPVGYDEVREFIFRKGQEEAMPKGGDAIQAFDYFDFRHLDGMPCDQTKEIFKQTPDEVIWRVVTDTHQAIWEEENSKVGVYYDLMGCYIAGMMQEAGFTYEQPMEGLHGIKRVTA